MKTNTPNTFSVTVATSTPSPVRNRRDLVGRIHSRPMPSAAKGSSRFCTFQKMLLDGTLALSEPGTRFAANLIAFDGIATRADLMTALGNSENLYIWRDQTCLDWADEHGRINRRYLSPFTKKTWASPSLDLSHPDAILRSLEVAITQLYPSPSVSRIDQLLHDSQAWLFENMPGPLFAHCTSLVSLSALPRTALAREEARNAICLPDVKLNEKDSDLGLAFALDGYFSPAGNDFGTKLIDELAIVCREKKSLADYLDKDRMLKGALAIATRSHEAGKTTSMIVAFIIDLIESGGIRKGNLSPGAISKYVRSVAIPLLTAFRDIDIEQLEEREFTSTYESILSSSEPGNRASAASALSAWHAFLQNWFDIPSISKSLYSGLPPTTPKANVIWPHELELVFEWISYGTCDKRLLDQILVSYRCPYIAHRRHPIHTGHTIQRQDSAGNRWTASTMIADIVTSRTRSSSVLPRSHAATAAIQAAVSVTKTATCFIRFGMPNPMVHCS